MPRFTCSSLAFALASILAAPPAFAHGESGPSPATDRNVVASVTPHRFDLEIAPSHALAFDETSFWSGLSLGGHVAFGLGGERSGSSSSLRSFLGGAQLGYDHQVSSGLVFGVVGDISFPYFSGDGVLTSRASTTTKLDLVSTVRARVGYALGHALLYGTGGFAWSQARFDEAAGAGDSAGAVVRHPLGWTAGAGAAWAIAPGWSVSLEYLFDRFGGASGSFASGAGYESAPLDLHSLRVGFDWHFGGAADSGHGKTTSNGAWPLAPEDWSAHGQLTFIEQGYFHFHSPYEGTNSLSGASQVRNTVSLTAFLGVRLWRGAEFFFNPEVDQGFGLSQTLGVAGFPNGEAQKASYPVPRLNIDRVMVRQTFGLGGEQEQVADAPNQLPGKRDVSRLTVTAGRMSVGDAFGLNTYAADPRTQFLNWNIYGSGSYDWTMDKPGFTWGAFAELNQKRWALRAGYFLEPTESNGNDFDTHMPTRGQYLIEPELRYSLFEQPGKLRVLGWATRANMGGYADAVAMAATTPNFPDIAATRRVRTTYGVVLNVEQALGRDLGLFSRLSWSPGLVEVMGWTDCDESVSFGGALTGASWGRPRDTFGLAGVIEGLSQSARAFFAAGGLGIVVGDGRLDYRPEEVLEAYYAIGVAKWATLTLDYQLVANPAYNADRGPISIYAARLHAEL